MNMGRVPSTEVGIGRKLTPAVGWNPSGADSNPDAEFRREIRAHFGLIRDLGNAVGLDHTLALLAVRLRQIISWDSMAVYVLRDNVLVPEYVTGNDSRVFSSLRIPIGHGLSGRVAASRNFIVNWNPLMELEELMDPPQALTLRSALAVPLEGQTGVIGVLSLYRVDKDGFTPAHLRSMATILPKVALFVENALRFKNDGAMATIDSLTTLPNTRSLFPRLDAELSRARRMKNPIGILAGKLDGFKQVNERMGPLGGNLLLRWIAQDLKRACREYDYVARTGSDEFVFVLPGLTPDHLEARCDRLREVVVAAGRQVSGAGTLDISIGQSFFPSDGDNAEELLAGADWRMYMQ
jgi:diguanylate cyclase (GGDEF)-like protein